MTTMIIFSCQKLFTPLDLINIKFNNQTVNIDIINFTLIKISILNPLSKKDLLKMNRIMKELIKILSSFSLNHNNRISLVI